MIKSTAPVGSYPEGASWCGALDLGNVWEWTADWAVSGFGAPSHQEGELLDTDHRKTKVPFPFIKRGIPAQHL
jgi:formylglycine-generating enzyme required for sulfatase activity